jgi:hypothetical protein
MTPAARSVYYFGFYLYLTGLTLIAVPNMFLQALQLPETNEVWIRVLGVVVFGLGFYYHRTGVQNNTSFFRLTIPTRVFVFCSFTAFVLLGYTAPILAGIGAVDLLGAAWTYFALKKQ